MYDSKSPQTWMQGLHDYVAGRTSEMDGILDWVEAQVEEIGDLSLNQGQQPMVSFATSLTEVSKQLWALLDRPCLRTARWRRCLATCRGTMGWKRGGGSPSQ